LGVGVYFFLLEKVHWGKIVLLLSWVGWFSFPVFFMDQPKMVGSPIC